MSKISPQERDKNRQMLHTLVQEFKDFRHNITSEVGQVKQQIGDTSKLQQMVQKAMQQMQQMEQHMQSQQQELHTLKGQVQQATGAAQEVSSMKRELQSVKDIKNEVQSVQRNMKDLSSMKGDLNQVKTAAKDLKDMKSELQNVKKTERDVHGMESKIDQMKKGMTSNDKLTQLEQKFEAFKKMIYDKGVLAPKVEKPAEGEPEPVGSVSLGEDVFTARVLIHLGFLKARQDSKKEEDEANEKSSKHQTNGEAYAALMAPEDSEDYSADDDDEDGPVVDDDNVHGITDMSIEPGAPGYLLVKYGWLFVCFATLALQVLIVLILIQSAEGAGDGCLDHPMPMFGYDWWLLHMSKAMAVFMAGILLGQELMDALNMVMVSILVEHSPDRRFITWGNAEALFFGLLRLLLAALIAVANVYIFSYITHAANVWINMTALAFIGEIGTGMLEVARRGVFGHYLMKTITEVNFEMTFVKEYPAWFPAVRGIALMCALIFVLFCAGLGFEMKDDVCPGVLDSLTTPAPGGAIGHIAHHAVGHHGHGHGHR
mmetsp:Transcript_146756/g.267532  ORF Transcript_146756/g.267532 Transcript_146756/m.267532 type:complete len:543 (-) Transcript_146756:197-1825(-)